MITSVSAPKPFQGPTTLFGLNKLAYTYGRQCGAYGRLVERIKLLCSGDRLINVEVHEKKVTERWLDGSVTLLMFLFRPEAEGRQGLLTHHMYMKFASFLHLGVVTGTENRFFR